jgi:L-lactate dehydrogenase complex protein LldF
MGPAASLFSCSETSRPEVMKRIDPHLRRILRDFSRGYLQKRENALAGLDFERLRTELSEVKEEALSRCDELVALFEAKASQKGARVYRAADSAEANRRIYEILKSNRARFLVKGKSMVSEETGLNAFLEKRGIKVRETDLGEWIVQLAGDQPTHMVMPAIHLTRRDVARVFSRHLERDVPEEIPALVRLAREELRREIFQAGAGLIGANALVAENGSVLLVTNEGNGRMVSTLPPLLIVLTSIEKILPSTRDALLLLRVLPANATGQNITSYVSFIAPSPEKNLHIILLDNHRSEILKEPVFREILRCIKCSACLNVCPVYQTIGGKRYAHIYMGGIGTLFTAWIHGRAASRDLADYCLSCHRCEAVCAAKIRVPDLVIALRERLNRETGKRLWKRLAFDGVIGHPGVTRALFSSARSAGPLLAGKGEYARRLPPLLRKYDRFRALPRLARQSLLAQAGQKVTQKGDRKGPPRVVLFAGCLVEHFYPRIGLDALRVLERLGYKVALSDSACCGFPAANAGFREAAAKSFRRLAAGLENAEVVLTLCPTCTTMLAQLGPEILGTGPDRHLARRVVPFSRFLFEREWLRLEGLLSSRPPGQPVTYHDSCHHKYVLQASGASRDLLELALGGKLREMESPDSCCGFGGSFSISHPEVSASLIDAKLESIRRSGARVVAMDCPGCVMQIRGGSARRGEKLEVRHTAEILAACLDVKR